MNDIFKIIAIFVFSSIVSGVVIVKFLNWLTLQQLKGKK